MARSPFGLLPHLTELHLQAQQVRGATLNSALRGIVHAGGVPALFTAIRPALVCAALGYGVYFGSYRYFKNTLENAGLFGAGSITPTILAAGAAGWATALVNNPLVVLKARIILSLPVDLRKPLPERTGSLGDMLKPRHLPVLSSADAFKSIRRTGGWRGFYAGLSPALVGNVEGTIHMVLYEFVKQSMLRSYGAVLPPSAMYASLTTGCAAAKVASTILAYPCGPGNVGPTQRNSLAHASI